MLRNRIAFRALRTENAKKRDFSNLNVPDDKTRAVGLFVCFNGIFDGFCNFDHERTWSLREVWREVGQGRGLGEIDDVMGAFSGEIRGSRQRSEWRNGFCDGASQSDILSMNTYIFLLNITIQL